MRNTKQRNVIFEIVNSSCEHLSAYQVYELAKREISNISLGTVYRNLANLVQDNKIREIEVCGTLRFDKNTKHAHFICSKCDDIIDVFDSIFYDKDYIDGNLVMDYDVKIKGICKKCIGGN